MFTKPLPINREIRVDPSYRFNCKFSPDNTIEFMSRIMCDITGYEEYDLIGESIYSLMHPEMPKVLFDILEERLLTNKSMRIITKLIAKDGRFFWLLMDMFSKTTREGTVVSSHSISVLAPQYAVFKIQSLYEILSKIEAKTGNTKASKRYLIGFLEDRAISYDQYVTGLLQPQKDFTTPNPTSNKETRFQEQEPIFVNSETNPIQSRKGESLLYSEGKPLNKKVIPKKKSLFQRIFGW